MGAASAEMSPLTQRDALSVVPSMNSFIFPIAFCRQLLNHAQKCSWEGEKRITSSGSASSKGQSRQVSLVASAEKALGIAGGPS